MAQLNTGTSIVDYLKSKGQDSSYDNRRKMAKKYGIGNYTGTAEQNTALLNKVKSGGTGGGSENKVIDIKPVAGLKPPKPVQVGEGTSLGDWNIDPGLGAAQSFSIDDYKNYSQNKPADYQSAYSPQIASILGQIQNGQPFSYNMNTDPLYQQLAQQAMRNGNLAMRDTMGNASALSGGYGNSYAVSAGAQANDAYLQSLNDQIPELQQIAYQQYRDKNTDMYNQLSALQGAEQSEYSKYRDSIGDYYTDRDFNYNAGIDERNFNYQVGRDQVGDQQWQTQYDRGVYEDDRNYGYQVGRDEVEDQQWQDTFDYGKERDSVSDSQWQQEFKYNQSQDATNNSQWERQFQYNQEQDKADREAAKSEYLNKVAAEQSEDAAKESEKRINTYSGNVDKMLSATADDGYGGKSSKYSVKDVWDYLQGSNLTDDEIAIVVDGNYDLRKYIEGLGSGKSYSAGGGKY